jgi:hypothetical protein
MTDDRDQKLDNLLGARRVEPPSPELAQRIILKVRSLPQASNIPLWQWMRQLFAEFHLPNPGYVLASALVLGVALGFSAPLDRSAPQDVDPPHVQNVFSTDEALL